MERVPRMAPKSPPKLTAVVIGAGLSGISVASRLAHAGHLVTVVERAAEPGGRCAAVRLGDGHVLDAGPTFVLVPDAFEEAFRAVGAVLKDELSMTRVDPTYQIFFGDGSSMELTADLQRMKSQLEAIEPGAFAQFLEYLAEAGQHFRGAVFDIAHHNFRTFFSWFSLRNLLLLLKLHVFEMHYSRVKRRFADSNLRAAFTFQDMYIGLSPFEAPATFSLLQHAEFVEGVWYTRGGLHEIPRALERVAARCGAKFRYNTPVDQVVVEDGRACGVRLQNGEVLKADVVVATADLPLVYSTMLPKPYASSSICDNARFTSSAVCFYWATDKVFPSLQHHNMFLATESDAAYRSSFETIFEANGLPEVPSFYINAPARSDDTVAPKGKDSLMVLVPCGHLPKDGSGEGQLEAIVARARSFVLDKLKQQGITDLEEHIVAEKVYAPADWRDSFALAHGSAFGLNHVWWQLGWLRPHNKHASLDRLYFAGCSTHPGSGLPNVLVSARLATERLLEDLGPPPPGGYTAVALVVFAVAVALFSANVRFLEDDVVLTYFRFHCIFILPQLLAVCATLLALPSTRLRLQALVTVAALCAVAFVWTTPWDNYLVYSNVWRYAPGRVAGVVGYVPYEEYAFFVLQTLVTGTLVVIDVELSPPESCPPLTTGYRHYGAALNLALAAYGAWCIVQGGAHLYLGLILAWALPVSAFQWWFGGDQIYADGWRWVRLVGVTTLYLCFADSIAIKQMAWAISEQYTLGLMVPVWHGLPLEEVVFFLITNVLIVQGLQLACCIQRWDGSVSGVRSMVAAARRWRER